ncbi:putative calcium binding protein hemolysin [Salipiger mucosus DSM 16094]|uniref:Putative calcium binding protein hemolysin n=1 Tax=Salipiger mucosus DSM 16094 TaxID=1123237 RepID=S9Q7I9_9RHOB|nr:putative calcium binding protein hemolysin [Salipiger mucosus DSM 16094]
MHSDRFSFLAARDRGFAEQPGRPRDPHQAEAIEAEETAALMTSEATLFSVSSSSTAGGPQGITIDGEKYVPTFVDEFNGSTTSFWTGYGSGGTWATSFSPHLDDTRNIASNNELQYYIDPDMTGLPNPFTLDQGVLTIRASELDAAQQQLTGGLDYGSGMLSTEMTFDVASAYIEIRADVPDEQGFWSAFWMLPADGDWSSEIDIFEILGGDAGTVHTNLWTDGTPDADFVTGTGAGDGFHTYGLFWDADTIQWFYDGTMIRETANTVTEEMFLVINLAIGGWAGSPDATTDFGNGLGIDYLRVYELESDPGRNPTQLTESFEPGTPDVGTAQDDVINGTRWDDVIKAGSGNDTVYGDAGDDLLRGQAGADRLFGQAGDDTLQGSPGNDHLVGGTGADLLSGASGTDHMWGGAYGADGTRDEFVFSAGGGTDYIHDFEVGIDVVDLTAFASDWTSVQSALTDQSWATYLDLALLGGQAGDGLFLVGIEAASLTIDGFLLAT